MPSADDDSQEKYTAHRSWILATVSRRVHNREDALDLASDVWTTAWELRGRFRSGPKPFRCWVYGVTWNVLGNYWRKLRWRRAVSSCVNGAAVRAGADRFTEPSDVLEKLAAREDETSDLFATVRRILTHDLKYERSLVDAWLELIVHDQSFVELGKRLGVHANAARVRFRSAMAKVAMRLIEQP